MEKVTGVEPTGCCEIFDPKPWNEKEISWNKRLFVRDEVFCLFHIPLNFGGVMKRVMNKIDKAKVQCNETFILAEDPSPWKEIMYMPVTKDVEDAVMEEISGKFLTKVFEGHYKNMGQWYEEMTEYVAKKGEKLEKIYTAYTTCPGCAKIYGKNYVILFAKIG